MKLFYRTFKKAILNENKEVVYLVKKKWSTVLVFDVFKNTVAKFSRITLRNSNYSVMFENNKYSGKQSFLTNIIDFDCGIIVKGGRYFSSPCASCVIKQADKTIATIRRDRGHTIFQEYEIEFADANDEKTAVAFLFPAIETLSGVSSD